MISSLKLFTKTGGCSHKVRSISELFGYDCHAVVCPLAKNRPADGPKAEMEVLYVGGTSE